MKKAATTFPVLSVAGKFPSIQREIANPLNLHRCRAMIRAKAQVTV